MRYAGQRDLERNRHLFFDFFGSVPRKQSHDGCVNVGDVRKRLHGERSKCDYAAPNEQRSKQRQKERLVEGERDQTLHHQPTLFSSSSRTNSAPSTTIRSPELRPEVTRRSAPSS